MPKLDRSAFIAQINTLENAMSIQGKTYHNLSVAGSKVYFTRQGKSRSESIDVNELYELYLKVDSPTNKEVRDYISGRVQSPAVSIINALSKKGAKNSSKPISAPQLRIKRQINKEQPKKDETRFFQAFSQVVGETFLLSKSMGKPISASDAFLVDDFRNYNFPEEVGQSFEGFLKKLNSSFNFSGKSIAHHIDGLLVNHPILGTRIVEFDEEQHFTPSLALALREQGKVVKLDFVDIYEKTLNDLTYLNQQVLRKNRIKHWFSSYPAYHNDFLTALENENVSGYIKPKENGFPFIGGRIAQRAYYDCLRNAAHLSPLNKGFQPILRFPKKAFEDECTMAFSNIKTETLVELTKVLIEKSY